MWVVNSGWEETGRGEDRSGFRPPDNNPER